MEQKDPSKICLRCGASMAPVINETGYQTFRCTEPTCKTVFQKILINETEEQSQKKREVRCGVCNGTDLRILSNEPCIKEFVCNACHSVTRTLIPSKTKEHQDFQEAVTTEGKKVFKTD
jgi:DNA-directed RNA polymerase subunit RPC12/RpoP